MRIDKYLKQQYPEYSRAFFQRLISSHNVIINGHPIKVHEKVTEQDKIEITWPKEKVIEKIISDSPLDILFEDEDVLVVSKPAHMVVHPAHGNPTGTFIEQIADYCGFVPEDFEDTIRPGLVHRLDKDTTGCLVIAKNTLSHTALANSMIKREFNKEYITLAVGDFPAEKGLIDAPLARSVSDRQMMAISTDKSAKPAKTKFEIISTIEIKKKRYNLVRIELLTGRTHQIRAHLKSIGCHILGDTKYGKNSVNADMLEKFGLDRQALHAWKLSFPHPEKDSRVEVTAPIPEDMIKAATGLGLDLELLG